MSSTEQKNVTQHFISHCFTYGIIPTICCGQFTDYSLETGRPPFSEIEAIPNLKRAIASSEDKVAYVRSVMPILSTAPIATRPGIILQRLTSGSEVTFGNQAVMRFASNYLSGRWNLHIRETGAVRHSRRHSGYIHSMLAPASYGRVGRAGRNAARVGYRGTSERYRNAVDTIDKLSRTSAPSNHSASNRRWCATHRKALGVRASYFKTKDALEAYSSITTKAIEATATVTPIKDNPFRFAKKSEFNCELFRQGGTFYISIFKYAYRLKEGVTKADIAARPSGLQNPRDFDKYRTSRELYVFNTRDLDDLKFLIHAGALFHLYTGRRLGDIRRGADRVLHKRAVASLWAKYVDVMTVCGRHFGLRNKLGVYFDVLQWRYMAWRSGNEFYDHSDIMWRKIDSKGLRSLPSQELLLSEIKRLPMDMAVDLLGIYKASIYPEVDPFKVVTDQYALHYSRHQTDWPENSPEHERFEQTRAYMWYLGIRVLRGILQMWPGKIREGVESKPWHARYQHSGIPGEHWRDACDVDLTGAMPQSDISNEQYMRQQDSACAPPHGYEFRDFFTMRAAPRHHKRKILYAVQERDLPDLPQVLNTLNELGRPLPQGYIGELDYSLPFSVDIVTGSRCERHKDAPRPFYAASSPWGCILSYLDGITRDYLRHVPQSMLGKSTRQKFLDVSTAAKQTDLTVEYFYVSDDKAKYSPRMDPQSQQLPAEFFAEVFDIPAFKAYGPIMYHCQLYYRVCGHLVSYGANGTDREGMRGACNTWLEIVAQGLATRLSREKNLTVGKSIFLSFIDDGLRRFSIPSEGKQDWQVRQVARQVLDEVIFGLRVLGRELSWDKTFVSRDLYVILNEIIYDGTHFSSGLKSFVTVGDIEQKEVMSAVDYEQIYFGKLKGAHSVGAPLDLCHVVYIHETLIAHYKLGANLQDNKDVYAIDYRLFCMTPVSFGGAGIRSMLQMGCTEIANATKEGIGNLVRLGYNFDLLKGCVYSIISQDIDQIAPLDFMREPEQVHVTGPRLKTQRVAAVVRNQLRNIAGNAMSRGYMEQDSRGIPALEAQGRMFMSLESVSAEEVRLVYSMSPVSFIDEFVQKLASSSTISQLLPHSVIATLRRAVRRDLVLSLSIFHLRCHSREMITELRRDSEIWNLMKRWVM